MQVTVQHTHDCMRQVGIRQQLRKSSFYMQHEHHSQCSCQIAHDQVIITAESELYHASLEATYRYREHFATHRFHHTLIANNKHIGS